MKLMLFDTLRIKNDLDFQIGRYQSRTTRFDIILTEALAEIWMSKCHFFVRSFCLVVQVAKTKKWIFISSFVRFVAFPTARRNDKTTKLPRNIKVWFVVVTCSFCRLFVLSTSTRRQNDRTTTRKNEVLRPFRFVVCSFCRVIQVAKTKKWNFILAVVRFVASHKAPKRTNEMAVSGFHALSSKRFDGPVQVIYDDIHLSLTKAWALITVLTFCLMKAAFPIICKECRCCSIIFSTTLLRNIPTSFEFLFMPWTINCVKTLSLAFFKTCNQCQEPFADVFVCVFENNLCRINCLNNTLKLYWCNI